MAASKELTKPRAKGRILFVENDQDTRELVTTALGFAGYETVTANSVQEGLKLAVSDRFDLIMLDWYFDDGTGIELCKMIRSFDGETPVFFYTGTAYESDVKDTIYAGAQGCFIKPVDIENLIRTLSLYKPAVEA